MAELVLALGILGTILISIVALFTMLLASSSKANNQTVGTYFAQQKLEQVILEKTFTNLQGSKSLYALDYNHQSNFHWTVTSTPISSVTTSPNGYKGGYWVQVDVYWWDGEIKQARAGNGLLYTSLGRFVYPGDVVP